MEKLTYEEFRSKMYEHNRVNNGKEYETAISGVIVITSDSFNKEYSLEERSYEVSSFNKAYMSGMGGYSIYGSSIDGSDKNVRLERYLREEKGGPTGWKVEYCYFQ